jgi:hypothetical protein
MEGAFSEVVEHAENSIATDSAPGSANGFMLSSA